MVTLKAMKVKAVYAIHYMQKRAKMTLHSNIVKLQFEYKNNAF